jgi:anti-anti-sigma regulatory factor
MSEDNHCGLIASSVVHTPDDACKLLVLYEPDFQRFRFAGIIDAQAKTVLDELPHRIEFSRITFDFEEVKRINSMGIALLLRCFKTIKDEIGAEIRLSNLSQVIDMLFKITGVYILAAPDEGQSHTRLH